MQLKNSLKLILSVLTLILIFVALFISYEKNINLKTPTLKPSKVNASSLIKNLKEEHKNLTLKEEVTLNEVFTSLLYEQNNRYQTFIVNLKSGKTASFQDFIKPSFKESYEEKEIELLTDKYPSFIVESLKKDSTKVYFPKKDSVLIYYYDYTMPYDLQEELFLEISYQKIKDYLNFSVTPTKDTEESKSTYDPNKKSVALTFDDGPSYKYNSLILEQLALNKAHATFFMVGQMMNTCQKCVLNTYQAGMEVASHTYEHLNIKTNSLETVKNSLSKVNALYHKITGDQIKLLRPPYGTYNKTNLANINMPFIMWSLDTEDWRYKDVTKIVNTIMDNVRDGSIILMHELYETSYEALKIVLPKLYAAGYQVVSVSELAALKNRTLEVGKSYTALY